MPLSDSLSNKPRNAAVWREAAYAISHGRLSTIFIECSYPVSTSLGVLYLSSFVAVRQSDRDAKLLYGHLSPPYLLEELHVLAREVSAYPNRRTKPLAGLNSECASSVVCLADDILVCIIHIKDCTDPSTGVAETAEVIEKELNALEETHQLGVKFLIVKQGMIIDL